MGLVLLKFNFGLWSFLCQYKCPELFRPDKFSFKILKKKKVTPCKLQRGLLSFLSMWVLSSNLDSSSHTRSEELIQM